MSVSKENFNCIFFILKLVFSFSIVENLDGDNMFIARQSTDVAILCYTLNCDSVLCCDSVRDVEILSCIGR